MGAAGLPFVHGFRVEKMRNWFGGIWVSTCLHFVHGFWTEKMRNLDFLSSMVEGARKEEVRIICLSKQWLTWRLSLRKWTETTVSEDHLSRSLFFFFFFFGCRCLFFCWVILIFCSEIRTATINLNNIFLSFYNVFSRILKS